MITANCGDCRALIIQSSDHRWVSLGLTEDNKPDIDGERARIEAAGEKVENGRVGGILAVSVSIQINKRGGR